MAFQWRKNKEGNVSSIGWGPGKYDKGYVSKEDKKKNKETKRKNKEQLKVLSEKLKSKTGSSGKTKAQRMAIERRMAKLSGTYKKPKTAKELAKERNAAKKAGTYKKPKTAQELATERIAKKKENEAKAQRNKETKKSINKIGGRGGFAG